MNLSVLGLLLSVALHSGHGKGFFSKFVSEKRSQNNRGNDNVDICETVRVMPRMAFAVVGGAAVKQEDSAPYVAAIGERITNGSISWFCGGSIVSPSHILTAAHCLVSRNVSTVRVGSFSTKKKSTEGDYEVMDIIIHPGYKITQSYNDIGILKLKNTIEFDINIKPICLPIGSDTYERERAKVIGWGAEEFGGDSLQKLQQVEVEVFSNSECEKAYRNSTIGPKTFPKGIISEQLCAGSKKGGKDACQGDSGGPLVLTDQHGIVRQIGIVSTGAGCGFKMYPGVYTRVSSYVDWIQKQVKNPDSAHLSQGNGHSSKELPKRSQLPKSKETLKQPEAKGSLLNTESTCEYKNKPKDPKPQQTSEKDRNSQNQFPNPIKSSSGKETFSKAKA